MVGAFGGGGNLAGGVASKGAACAAFDRVRRRSSGGGLARPERNRDGGHVLYMDGHVEFVPYLGKFPMTAVFFYGLRWLDAMERAT